MRFLLLVPLLLTACPKKQQPQAAPLDKDGIQRRSDAVHDDLKREEKKNEERKSED